MNMKEWWINQQILWIGDRVEFCASSNIFKQLCERCRVMRLTSLMLYIWQVLQRKKSLLSFWHLSPFHSPISHWYMPRWMCVGFAIRKIKQKTIYKTGRSVFYKEKYTQTAKIWNDHAKVYMFVLYRSRELRASRSLDILWNLTILHNIQIESAFRLDAGASDRRDELYLRRNPISLQRNPTD